MAERNVEQLHSDGSASQWLSDYAKDVWNKPGDHVVEIGIAAVASSAALLPLGRLGLKLCGERAAMASGEALMSQRALKNAVSSVRDLKFEVDSGFSTLVGRIGPSGERILRAADDSALRLVPSKGNSADVVFAHEVVLPRGQDKFTARFFADNRHSHTWSTADNLQWPEGRSGVFSSLKNAGIVIRPGRHNPVKLEFASDMQRLDVTPLAARRVDIALDAVLSGSTRTIGQSATSNRVASISIEGPDSVLKGRGLININNPQYKIEASQVFKYPEVHPGGNLRVYHDPAASVRPNLSSDVRFMSGTDGLLRPS